MIANFLLLAEISCYVSFLAICNQKCKIGNRQSKIGNEFTL